MPAERSPHGSELLAEPSQVTGSGEKAHGCWLKPPRVGVAAHTAQTTERAAVQICPVTERTVDSRGTARCALSHEVGSAAFKEVRDRFCMLRGTPNTHAYLSVPHLGPRAPSGV